LCNWKYFAISFPSSSFSLYPENSVKTEFTLITLPDLSVMMNASSDKSRKELKNSSRSKIELSFSDD
jgi:hypothetical protein